MNRTAFLLLILLGLSFAAHAEDWQGWYGGLHLGYATSLGQSDVQGYETVVGQTVIQQQTWGYYAPNLQGLIGGGQFGYNWVRDNWLFGLEAQLSLSHQHGKEGMEAPGIIMSAANASAYTNIADTISRIDASGAMRGRVGFFVHPDIVVYGTGGLMLAKVRTYFDYSPGKNASYYVRDSDTSVRYGLSLGVGAEWRFNARWSAKLEGIYTDLGESDFLSGREYRPNTPPSGQFASYASDGAIDAKFVTLQAGVNYNF